VRFAVLSAVRDVLARKKCVCAELVAGFIIVIVVGTVGKNPAAVLGTARLVDEPTDLVVFAFPKSPNATVVPILSPQYRVDVSLWIEGCDKIISMARRAVGKVLGAGKSQQDAIEVR
jgi:hypothetical protein